MTAVRLPTKRRHVTGAPRVGLFGILGAGNLGNDASMESVLGYVQRARPDAVVDAMCTGAARLTEDYGIEAIDLNWRPAHGRRRPAAVALIGLAKAIETVKIAAWVRRHEVVIVPGAGVLEASLPVRPWEIPYALFALCAWGRLFGTKVALVSVGANTVNRRMTRHLSNGAARLAFYRSYRDALSLDAMHRRGLDTSRDKVYADLVFGLPAPADDPGDPERVALGVMSYYGSNDDRRRADELHVAYVENMKRFVRWLVDSGRKVTLVSGDSVNDQRVVADIVEHMRACRPDLDPTSVLAEPAASPTELVRALRPAGTVVAIRYHNVITSLKLAKPTISIGYSPKHDVLMDAMGLADFCQSADSLDVDRLIVQFVELVRRSSELRRTIGERRAMQEDLVQRQFEELSRVLFADANAFACEDASTAPVGAV